MKLEQLFENIDSNDLLVLNEIFNTKIPVDEWKQIDGETIHGYITVNNERYVIILEARTYNFNSNSVPFVSVAFAKIDEQGIMSRELTLDNKSASKVIGAITNGLYDKLSQYDVNIIVFVARDNVQQRMRVYNYVANNLGRGFNITKQNISLPDGALATVMHNKNVDKHLILQFYEHLDTIVK